MTWAQESVSSSSPSLHSLRGSCCPASGKASGLLFLGVPKASLGLEARLTTPSQHRPKALRHVLKDAWSSHSDEGQTAHPGLDRDLSPACFRAAAGSMTVELRPCPHPSGKGGASAHSWELCEAPLASGERPQLAQPLSCCVTGRVQPEPAHPPVLPASLWDFLRGIACAWRNPQTLVRPRGCLPAARSSLSPFPEGRRGRGCVFRCVSRSGAEGPRPARLLPRFLYLLKGDHGTASWAGEQET